MNNPYITLLPPNVCGTGNGPLKTSEHSLVGNWIRLNFTSCFRVVTQPASITGETKWWDNQTRIYRKAMILMDALRRLEAERDRRVGNVIVLPLGCSNNDSVPRGMIHTFMFHFNINELLSARCVK